MIGFEIHVFRHCSRVVKFSWEKLIQMAAIGDYSMNAFERWDSRILRENSFP